MKQHLREINILKALAALSVIAIHITGPYVTVMDFAFVLNQGVRYAVPIFVVMSGLLLQHSYKNKKFTYANFLFRRFLKIGIPYVIWTFVYTLYVNRHNIYGILTDLSGYLASTAKNLLLGNGYDHLYFIVIIIQLYLIYPVLRYLMKKSKGVTLLIAFLITAYFQTAFFLFRYSMFYLPRAALDYYYIMLPTWVFYFVFGMFVSENIDRWRSWLLNTNKANLFIFWMLSYGALLTESKISNTYGSSIKPTVMIYCIMSFVFFYAMALQLKDRSSNAYKVLNWIGEQSFLIYLSHLLILALLKSYTGILNFNNLWAGEIGMLLCFFMTCILSAVFVYIMGLIPLAPWLGGVYKRRKA